MGELLQGPWATGSTEGAGTADRRSSSPRARPAAERKGPGRGSGASEPDPEVEDRWAVPGVDADEPVPLPEPAARSKRAEHVSIAALTRHDASEGEIRARLLTKGLSEQEAQAELDRLRGVGLLDDRAFAERQLERLRERKGLGDAAIRSALRGRLVPQDVIDAVLVDRTEEPEDVADRLQHLADDRARRLGALPRDVAERRLTAYLLRKGHGGPDVRAAVRAALDGLGIR